MAQKFLVKGHTKPQKDKTPPFPKPEKLLGMTIVDEKNLLTDEQKKRLLESVSLEFKLCDYTSLADILNKLGVTVYIVPGKVKRSTKYLDVAKEYWENKLKSQTESEIASKNLQIINVELDAVSCGYLRGCYIHDQKEILLFPEEMETEYDGKRMTELLVSTLAHEVMHAYFDRKGHSHYPYAYFVEEPLAEFGMLLYLQETRLSDILDWAKKDVASKQSCYHYGAVLYNQYMNWNPFLRRYLEEYKYNINKYEMLDVARDETAVGLPCPISVEPCGVEATATTTMATTSSTGRFNFCADSVVFNKSIYFSSKEIKHDATFQTHYPNTTQLDITLSFTLKCGKTISGVGASFYKGTQNLFLKGQLNKDFVSHFHLTPGIRFEFSEVNHAEWIAKEL